MAANPMLTFHDGQLAIPQDLQRDLHIQDGSQLRVVHFSPGHLVLEVASQSSTGVSEALAIWESLRGVVPDRRTPEWETEAEARKDRASKELDRLYASGCASATELKQAEREWEFADDELDFGPFGTS